MKRKKALERLMTFDSRGSKCPVCKQWFRKCPHSRDKAIGVLQVRVLEAS